MRVVGPLGALRPLNCVLWCRNSQLLLMMQEFVIEKKRCCGCVAVGRKADGCKGEGQIERSRTLYSVSCRERVPIMMVNTCRTCHCIL